MKAGKIWGTTELIEANGAMEFHRIEMNAGGVCSKHLHEFKWNGFFVESGKMIIRVWQNDYDLVDVTVLEAGQYTKVKPGIYHQFECVEDGVAFEIYWAEFAHNDIKRESVGYDINGTWDLDHDLSDSTFECDVVEGDIEMIPQDDTISLETMDVDWSNVTVDGKL